MDRTQDGGIFQRQLASDSSFAPFTSNGHQVVLNILTNVFLPLPLRFLIEIISIA
jgi:hypothetical protein